MVSSTTSMSASLSLWRSTSSRTPAPKGLTSAAPASRTWAVDQEDGRRVVVSLAEELGGVVTPPGAQADCFCERLTIRLRIHSQFIGIGYVQSSDT
jgi:hypothetical protein